MLLSKERNEKIMIDESNIYQAEKTAGSEDPHKEDHPAGGSSKRVQKTFLQRNKYRIRQICGVAFLLIIITSLAVLITKHSGSEIKSGDSEAQAFAEKTESEAQSTTALTTTTTASQSTTTSATVTEDTTTQQTTSETTTQQTTTTQSATNKPQTSTTTKAADNKDPEVIKPTVIKGILVVNKSYPLPADYDPGGLTAETAAAFNKMQKAAALDGIQLWICSGYRSYYTQQSLFTQYCWRDGVAKAETYSARPGHSEHNCGLAVDLCTPFANDTEEDFYLSPQARWLCRRASVYGFILRYPRMKEHITGIDYEPWHYRYVGAEAALPIAREMLREAEREGMLK